MAYEKADNIFEMKERARTLGIIWPDGHFFEKTEFRWKGYESDLEAVLSERREGLEAARGS